MAARLYGKQPLNPGSISLAKPDHVFISYATEDEAYATELARSLQWLGLSVWFAPIALEIGGKLLDSINAGLIASQYGLLLLSPIYVSKKWTTYELDVLHRQHIEEKKKLLPIWHGIRHSWTNGILVCQGLLRCGARMSRAPSPRRLPTWSTKGARWWVSVRLTKTLNGDFFRDVVSSMRTVATVARLTSLREPGFLMMPTRFTSTNVRIPAETLL